MNLDSMQVALRLTTDQFILNELRRKKRFTRDPLDPKTEVFRVQFDSREFAFSAGNIITVGQTIANCLIADSRVIVGSALDGEVYEVLETVKEFNLSSGESLSTPTTCVYCKMECSTARGLAEHLLDNHDTPDESEETIVEAPKSHPSARNSRAKTEQATKETKDTPDANS